MRQVFNTDIHGKVMLQGYDPVTFHTISKAVKGHPAISIEHEGQRYLFASYDNRESFKKGAEKYVPAYGGYCAYGLSHGVLFPVEIDTWEIVDDRLMLQFSQDVKERFHGARSENIRKADENWLEIVAESGKHEDAMVVVSAGDG
ncbi:MAG: YHS domain-containing (seleno)protein [Thermodesulfobacteriota bacterium]